MDEIQVMTVIQLKSAGDALVKKMVDAAYGIPLKIIRIWIRYNLKMIYLVIDSYLMVTDVLQSALLPAKLIPKGKANQPEATVNTEEIVRGVKKLRRSLLVNIDQYYGLKFKADNEEAVKRLDELRDSITGSEEQFQEALKKIDEMNVTFREERKELFKDVEELEIYEIIEAINENKCVDNVIVEAEHNQVSNLPREHENLGMNVCHKQLNGIQKHIPPRRKNGVSKNRLNSTNIKLEQILRVSSNLVGELNKLNLQVGHLAEMSQRMADMQCELGAGRKLLSEVEADRNEMQRKLLTLERLIKEEEKYLDEFSYESGFEENEMPVSL